LGSKWSWPSYLDVKINLRDAKNKNNFFELELGFNLGLKLKLGLKIVMVELFLPHV
jgi:hypothetical protein